MYATTGHRSILDFTLNDHTMGEVVEMEREERRNLAARVTSQTDLRRVEIIRNGEPAVAQSAASRMHSLTWEDRRRGVGPDCYYVRVTMWDGGMAWSSPIWVYPKGAKMPGQPVGKAQMAPRGPSAPIEGS